MSDLKALEAELERLRRQAGAARYEWSLVPESEAKSNLDTWSRYEWAAGMEQGFERCLDLLYPERKRKQQRHLQVVGKG